MNLDTVQVPLLDLKAQLEPLLPEINSAITNVVSSCQFVLGKTVLDFEEQMADYLGVKHTIGVTSGSDALLVSLMALDVRPGDVVITPDYSFFATAGAVARLFAKPSFVDINPDSYNICPKGLRATLEKHKQNGDNVKAIIPVHLYGQCADMDEILSIAGEFDIPVIEDAAQAIGAKCRVGSEVKLSGSMGLAGCFSFFPSKNLGCFGDGGLVSTNDSEFAEKIKVLRDHGSKPRYHHSVIGGNFRLDALQAAVLSRKLPHLESWEKGRQKNAAFYNKNITNEKIKKPVQVVEGDFHVYNQYIISISEKRDELQSYLTEAKIGTAIYYPIPFCKQTCFSEVGADESKLQNSIYASEHTLALPIYPELTEDMLGYVVEKLNSFS